MKQNDIVKIKKDISNHTDYVREMKKYQGREVTIDIVNGDEFYIKEDDGMWTWYYDMIEI